MNPSAAVFLGCPCVVVVFFLFFGVCVGGRLSCRASRARNINPKPFISALSIQFWNPFLKLFCWILFTVTFYTFSQAICYTVNIGLAKLEVVTNAAM